MNLAQVLRAVLVEPMTAMELIVAMLAAGVRDDYEPESAQDGRWSRTTEGAVSTIEMMVGQRVSLFSGDVTCGQFGTCLVRVLLKRRCT